MYFVLYTLITTVNVLTINPLLGATITRFLRKLGHTEVKQRIQDRTASCIKPGFSTRQSGWGTHTLQYLGDFKPEKEKYI